MGGREISLLKIGEFAKKGDVSKRSLRHYEELGLLTPKKRSSGGFRLYRETDLFKLEIIKIFKELGFTLGEIKQGLKDTREAGVDLEACVTCAKKYGLVSELEELGIDVYGMGKPLTDYLKGDTTVMTV